MLDDLQLLIDLQKLDEQLVASEEESAGLPGRRAERAEMREAAQQRVVAAKEALQEAESEQRHAESALQDQEALIQRLEGQQFQVKSNEAYTALLREMEHAREAISDSETRLLEAMDAIEAGRASGIIALIRPSNSQFRLLGFTTRIISSSPMVTITLVIVDSAFTPSSTVRLRSDHASRRRFSILYANITTKRCALVRFDLHTKIGRASR